MLQPQCCDSFLISIVAAFLLVFLHPAASLCTNPTADHVRAGFWYSHSNAYAPLASINASVYTHLYYYSLSLDASTFHVVLPPSPEELSLLANFSVSLKTKNPSLKTILSISSIDQQSGNSSSAFSTMAGHPSNRAAFINSAVELARTYQFDGLDLSWQFPSSPPEMTNLGMLLTEWRGRVNQESNNASRLLLTASVYFSGHLFNAQFDNVDYPIDAISNSLDWANALCFGYHGDGLVTGTDAALFDVASHFSTSYGITSWLDAGLPPCKLVVGIPLYGRSWFLKNKMKYGLGAEAVAAGPKQKPSNQTGIMAYFEIEQLLNDPDAEFTYDGQAVSAYCHVRNVWVSFDSPEVVKEKITFVQKNELLGYFLWPVSYDSPNGTISRLALEVWMGHIASSDEKYFGMSNAESLSPRQLQPEGLANQSSANSIARQTFSVFCNFLVLCILLLDIFCI